MPTYAFKCRACGAGFEELVKRMGEIAPCPRCGSKDVELKISSPAVGRAGSQKPGCDAGPPNCGFS